MHRNLFRILAMCFLWNAIELGPKGGAYVPSRIEAQEASSAGVKISFRGIETELPIISTMVMPGEKLLIRADAELSVTLGGAEQISTGWAWRAPDEPGMTVLTFERDGQQTLLKVFVLVPWQNGQSDKLNGYRIGAYSVAPFRGLSTYAPPRGFIDVRPEWLDEKVSPHFTLRQFLCKQQPGHDPTYALVRSETLLKLEALLKAVNEAGVKVDTLALLSGFRTPWYNRSIGNKTTSSRHLFGGAVDVFVDADGDGWMDDVNGDGIINKNDARWLADLGERLAADHAHNDDWLPGGLGVYAANAVHGPFVHVDTRGYQARWGR